jgi:hypothetical protein
MSTQSIYDKLYVFTGPRGEDTKKISENWPFPEPLLNNMEEHIKRQKRGDLIVEEILNRENDC